MSANKATIHIGPVLSGIIGPAPALSERITAMAVRLEAFHKQNVPELSRGQWLAIMDANNGGSDWIAENMLMPSGIWANIEDTSGLGEKWGIDQKELLRRLKGMSTSELLAVDESISRFWMHSDIDTDQALSLAGCRISE